MLKVSTYDNLTIIAFHEEKIVNELFIYDQIKE